MQIFRTPDSQFSALPDFPFEPHYTTSLANFSDMRVHFVDDGPSDAQQTFLCLHGQPTWSYLYRKMIPVFVQAGHRVVAPDLLGFGRSDKPVDESVYTFDFHRQMLIDFVLALDLRNITLVCQDWGGILGLTLPMEFPERFSRLLVMNTTIADGRALGEGFTAWRAYNRTQHNLDIAGLMRRGCPQMSEAEALAYAAPYPGAAYKSGVRRFPELVMTSPDMAGVAVSKRARQWWTDAWTGQTFMAVGAADPVLGGAVMEDLRATIKNCPPPFVLDDVGHFVQEAGDIVARAALDAFAVSP